MHCSENGLHLIESFEGFSSRPYWDPYGRVWTRGYGETNGITRGSPAINRHQAQENLARELARSYEPAIDALDIPLNQNQYDALCSFLWNLGPDILTGQLRATLRAHQWDSAANQMLAYDHAGGQTLPGLQRRRRTEAQLFLTPTNTSPAYIPADEARWEHEYDQLHNQRGSLARLRRRLLQRAMTRRRKQIWRLSQPPGTWNTHNRPNRYRKLLTRTEN